MKKSTGYSAFFLNKTLYLDAFEVKIQQHVREHLHDSHENVKLMLSFTPVCEEAGGERVRVFNAKHNFNLFLKST